MDIVLVWISLLSTLCTAVYSPQKTYYMDKLCDSSLYLKDHAPGLDVHLTSEEAYGGETNCSVRVVARTHHRIVVSFVYLDISSFVSCPGDYLSIQECEDRCTEVIKYCGVTIPSTSYTSSSNVISLNFVSDTEYAGKGFHLYLTTFHKGVCKEDEVKCLNGRCIPSALRCSKGDNCNDGSDFCTSIVTPPVIAGFVVGGVIIVFTLSIALVLLWYHRKYRIETRRCSQEHIRERYIRRESNEMYPTSFNFTNHIIFNTVPYPTHIPPCLPSSLVTLTEHVTSVPSHS